MGATGKSSSRKGMSYFYKQKPTSFFFHQVWYNAFLTWNKTKYCNISRIQLDPKLIWKPDVVLYNRFVSSNNTPFVAYNTPYFATRAGSPQLREPITVGPYHLCHPVNIPCGRKPEYPQKTHDFRQSVDYTLFT